MKTLRAAFMNRDHIFDEFGAAEGEAQQERSRFSNFSFRGAVGVLCVVGHAGFKPFTPIQFSPSFLFVRLLLAVRVAKKKCDAWPIDRPSRLRLWTPGPVPYPLLSAQRKL